MALGEFETSIREAFELHREQRQGLPVFGLEHGLTSESVFGLKKALGHLVRSQSAERAFRKFPLCVVACSSEIGYEYRGTGTDFWPKLETEIAAGIDEAGRQAHTHAFLYAHRTLNLKSPPETPWARNFRHIAWPITNAIASREIHRPLARALRRAMTFAFADASTEEIVARLTIEARSQQNTRLTEWFKHTDVASALITRLLDLPLEENAIEIVSLDRIVADLEADPIAKESVTSASERRKAASIKRATPQFRYRIVVDADGNVGTALQVPIISGPVLQAIERELGRSGGVLSLAEGGCELETGRLFPGTLLDLHMTSFRSLLSGDATLLKMTSISVALFEHIWHLMPTTSDPMIFVEDSVPGTFAEWKSDRKIPKDRRVILATSKAATESEGLLLLADTEGVKFLEVEIPSEAGELHLSKAGAHIETEPVCELIGGIRLSEGLLGPVFTRGMPVLLKRSQSNKTGDWIVRSNVVPPVKLTRNDVAAVLDDTSDHQKIEIETDDAKAAIEIDFFSAEGASKPLAIQLDPLSPSVEDIQRGQLRIQFASPLELDDVSISIAVYSGRNCLAFSSGKVARIPASIGAGSKIVQDLADDLVRIAPDRSAHLFLEVSLHNIWKQRWRLEWDPVEVNWFNNEGAWYALANGDELYVLQSEASQPLCRAGYERTPGQEREFRALLPEIDGTPIYLAAICDGPRALKPGEIEPHLPSTVCRRMVGGEEGAGFEDTVHNYMLWSVTRPVHPIASLASRTVAQQIEELLVQQLCGCSWIEAEQRSQISAGSLFNILAAQAVELGLVTEEGLPPIPSSNRSLFESILSQKMQAAWPKMSADAAEIDFEQFADRMAGAAADAYEELALSIAGEDTDAFADAYPYAEPERWHSAHRFAVDQMSGRLMSRLILPAARAEQLQTWDYGLPRGQIVSLLEEVHTDLSPRGQKKWITASNIQDCLHLWIEPAELLREGEWVSSIARFLQDRQTARAIRYAALRYRAARSKAFGHD